MTTISMNNYKNLKALDLNNFLLIAKGIVVLSLLAQIKIPLPWSPVPITGQTFGVALLALSMGRKNGFIITLSYLLLGFSGAPIFAGGSSGLSIGPTFGYLIGMLFSSIIMGQLKDLGLTTTFFKTLSCAYIGSIVTFSLGLFVLSYFVPNQFLLMAGLFPFLIGDLIKNTIASVIVSKSIY